MKIKAIFLLLIFVFLFSGCQDLKEIDETAYIVALAIDKCEGDGFSYTFQFSKPLAITSDSENSEEQESSSKEGTKENSSVSNLEIEAPDFYIAKNLTNNFLSKNVDMSHLKLIVFSSEISAADLEEHSQLLLREREIRPHTSIAITANSAAKYLENVNPELESNTSKYYELLALRSNNIYAPTKRLHDFVDEISAESRDTALPIATNPKELRDFPSDSLTDGWINAHNLQILSDRSILYGMAIFKNGELANIMDGDSALIFNILTKEIDHCTITLRDKYNSSETLSFRIIVPEKANFHIDIKNKQITASQELQAEFLGAVLPEGYHSFDELYSYANKVLSERMSDFLIHISQKHSADILNLRGCLRTRFLTWNQWNNFDWKNFYKSAKFLMDIEFI